MLAVKFQQQIKEDMKYSTHKKRGVNQMADDIF